MEHQRACARCATTPRQFVKWWLDRATGEKRAICFPCAQAGWRFDPDGSGLPRRDPALVLDGGTRRAAAGLMRGSVGRVKGRQS